MLRMVVDYNGAVSVWSNKEIIFQYREKGCLEGIEEKKRMIRRDSL